MKFPWQRSEPVPTPGPTSDLQTWLDAALAELHKRGEDGAERIRWTAAQAAAWLKENVDLRDGGPANDNPPVFYVAVPFERDRPWRAPWALNLDDGIYQSLFPDAVRPDHKLPAGEFTIIVTILRKEVP